MSVEPGYCGQSFHENAIDRVNFFKTNYPEKIIEVDGGVSIENSATLAKNGADILVAGSAIFKSKDPVETIKQMKKSITCVGMFQQMPWKPPYDKCNKKYGQQNHVEHQLLGAYAFIYHGLSKIFLITIKRGCFFILTNDQLSFMSNSNIGKSNILKF